MTLFLRMCVGQGWVQIRICKPNCCVFELKITKGRIFVFDIWSVFEKYLQIQSNTLKITILPKKDKELPDINWLRSLDRRFFNCGQVALRTLAYSQAGQTLASMNE